MTMKRKSWQDYQKEIADDHYYYARSCIRQNFFPGSEKLFIDMLRNDLGKDLSDDPKHSAFDVTDNSLISAIITEKGICRPPYSESLKRLFE